MKTHVLTVSKNFPRTHPKAGKSTHFISQIKYSTCQYLSLDGLKIGRCCENCEDEFNCATTKKLHTIRANYELWKKRIDDVNKGIAILSLRYWSGKPYNSKQIEFARLDKNSGCGVQKIDFSEDYLYTARIDDRKRISVSSEMVCEHDGLNESDFESWFKGYDLSKPMAIIHFTNFRY